ncbi:MAG: N-acetylmuramic acid 6-phosphate etherase [Pseudorhodobacter sp.]|nr:N-acetylmuramic acid 6-phosphate etherase [Pseudorhodobacter sp.]
MPQRRTEQQHRAASGLQALPAALALTHLMDAQLAAAAAVRAALPQIEAAATLACGVIAQGGKLGYGGAGSSGLMALADCLELAGTFGIAPERTPMLLAGGVASLLHMTGAVEDDAGRARADLAAAGLGRGDALICVSASGATPYTLALASGARASGAALIAMANVAGAALLRDADVAILLDTGPEVIAGSTRMGAATAQKIALNLISTLMAIKLGHVFDGYMVNLSADNAKLRDRACRIVARLAATDAARAATALAAAGGDVKTAVLIAAGARGRAAAASLLQASHGQLGPALAAQATHL